MVSEKEFEIKCPELNLIKLIKIKELRHSSHSEYNDWSNLEKCLEKAVSILGYCYYPNSFFEFITKMPDSFSKLNTIETIFKLAADFKGIVKFSRKHGKSTYSRYSDDYESLRILTTLQMIKYNGEIIRGFNSWPRVELIDHIKSLFGNDKNAKVLDAGCGPGLNMYILLKSLPELTIDGFEYTHARLASCIINLIYESKINQLFLGDITKIELPDDSYDVVFTNHVLEQLGQEGAEKALAEAVRIAKKGVVLCEPAIQDANIYEKWRMNKLGYCRDLLTGVKKIPNCKVTYYKEDRFRNYPNTSNTLVIECSKQ